jgi:hypothetical protein
MKDPLTEPDENGYLIFCNSGKFVHRWVMEAKILHRPLEKGEEVHHIDGDRRNNSPENLVLMTREEHYRLHKHQRILEEKTVKSITTTFAVAGAIIFTLGLLVRIKLDLWYIGLVWLIAALIAWFFLLRKHGR